MHMTRLSLAALASLALIALPVGAQQSWTATETAFGRKGAPQAANVMRFNFPRTDLTVTTGGVTLKPAFALGSWVAMLPTGNGQVMAMGDLVLLDAELKPGVRALEAG